MPKNRVEIPVEGYGYNPSAGADWPEYGHDGGDSSFQAAGAVPAANLSVIWRRDFGPGAVTHSISVVDGRAYVVQEYGLHAVGALSGATIWSRSPGAFFHNAPAVENGTVYVVGEFIKSAGLDEDLRVYAYDAANGTRLWDVAFEASWGGKTYDLTVANGLVYVANHPHANASNLYAIDSETGSVAWSLNLSDRTSGGDRGAFRSRPIVAGGHVFIADETGVVNAINATTGSIVTTVPWNGFTVSLAAVDERLYVAGTNVTAYDLGSVATGTPTVEWTDRVGGFGVESIAIANETLLVATSNATAGKVIAYDAASGSEHWRYDPEGSPRFLFGFAAGGGVVSFVNDWTYEVVGLNSGVGARLWNYSLPGGTLPEGLAATDCRLFVNSDEAVVLTGDCGVAETPTTGSPEIGVSPGAIDLGQVSVGENTTARINVTNTGTAPLNVTGTSITGVDAPAFGAASDDVFVLDPGETRTITVAFSPGSVGSKTATLSVTSNDTDTLVDVSLSGQAITCINAVVAGSNGRIGLTEIQRAINWWAEDTEVPNTGGRTIGLSKIQSLINAWAEDTSVTCS